MVFVLWIIQMWVFTSALRTLNLHWIKPWCAMIPYLPSCDDCKSILVTQETQKTPSPCSQPPHSAYCERQPSHAESADNRIYPPFRPSLLYLASLPHLPCSHLRLITSKMPCCLWVLQYKPLEDPSTLKNGCFLHPLSLHLECLTSTIPSSLCPLQYSPLEVPSWLNVGCLVHPLSRHLPLMTSTMPASLCKAQYTPALLPLVLKFASVVQPGAARCGLCTLFVPLTLGRSGCRDRLDLLRMRWAGADSSGSLSGDVNSSAAVMSSWLPVLLCWALYFTNSGALGVNREDLVRK